MLTVSQEDDDLFDALEAGAIGYLLKDTSRFGCRRRCERSSGEKLPCHRIW